MSLKVLIVEDVFIEADQLNLALSKAGHVVTGVARSVEQALNTIKKERPDVVLLDIFLQGDRTGIHLARILGKQGIPFIYLSANSNPTTMDAAKETHPYGFLVKPFREKDVLIALDIASHRHRHEQQLVNHQQQLLGALLDGLIKGVAEKQQMLLLLVNALQRFIPFDHILIDAAGGKDPGDQFFCFQRAGIDEYKRLDLGVLMKSAQLEFGDLVRFRADHSSSAGALLRNGSHFSNACLRDKVLEAIHRRWRVHSGLVVPVEGAGGSHSMIAFFSQLPEGFDAAQVTLLESLRGLLSSAVANINTHRDTMPATPLTLNDAKRNYEAHALGIVGRSPRLLHVLDLVMQVAPFTTTVLLSGETGVGKEGLANAIHQFSPRKSRPMVKINCAAIPASLIESELFGHERGAFTSAIDRRIGKFEQADGGTVFLDEIGELPAGAQAKLLRVLQEKEIERIGGGVTTKIDVRIIAATNRDLYEEMGKGNFRMDLYYRLLVFPILVPPLRERKEDIPLLAGHFLQQVAFSSGRPAKTLSDAALRQLMDYPWPGNIRELQHSLERRVVTTLGLVIEDMELPEHSFPAPGLPAATVEDTHSEKNEIVAALAKCNGKVSGKGGAAELLGINPNTLSTRMRKLGISWKYILK